MLTHVRTMLMPPVFDDDDQTHLANLLNTILLSLACLTFLYLTFRLVLTPYSFHDLAITLLSLAYIGSLLFLLRYRQVRLVGYANVLGFWAIDTYVIFFKDKLGLHHPIFVYYIALVVVTGITLGGRAALWLAGLTLVVSLGFATLMSMNPIGTADWATTAYLWVNYGMIMVLISIFVGLAHRNIIQVLKRARNSEKSLLRHNQELTAEIAERRQAQESLAIINKVAGTLHGSLNLQTVLEQALDAIVEYTDAPAVILNLFNKVGILESFVVRGVRADMVQTSIANMPLPQPDRRSLTTLSLQQKRIVSSVDVISDERLDSGIKRLTQDIGCLSAVSVPMILQEHVQGTIGLFFKEPYPLTAETESTLLSIGKTIALAIMNARHVSQIEAEVRARREAEEKYRGIFENAAEGIFQSTPEGHFLMANPALAQMLGYESPQDLIQNITNIASQVYVNPAERKALIALGERGDEGIVWEYESQFYKKDGGIIDVSIYSKTIHDDNGETLFFEGLIRDITEQKAAQKALEHAHRELQVSRDTLQQLIYQTPVGIQMFDTEGLCIDVNQAHLDIFGVRHASELVGCYNIFDDPLADRVGTTSLARRALAGETITGKEFSFDFSHSDSRYARTEGQRMVSVAFFPVFDANSQIVNLVALNQDITDIKRAQAQQIELAVTMERERAEIMREFLSNAAHDLRTPLTILNTSLYLLKKSPTPEKQSQYIGQITEQTQRFQQIIENMLMLSRLDMAQNELQFMPIDINAFVEDVCTQHEDLIAQKQHQMTLDLDRKTRRVHADTEALTIAINHVLINAISYTPDGGNICVRTYQNDASVYIEIADNGIGITTADLPHVFERFYRADKARQINSGSSGLGLAIARKIMQVHRGDIDAKSKPGEGSVFRLWLPLKSE